MESEQLARLLSGAVRPETDEERGALVLVALNYHMLRKQEDRTYVESVKRVAQELAVGFGCDKARGQAA